MPAPSFRSAAVSSEKRVVGADGATAECLWTSSLDDLIGGDVHAVLDQFGPTRPHRDQLAVSTGDRLPDHGGNTKGAGGDRRSESLEFVDERVPDRGVVPPGLQ